MVSRARAGEGILLHDVVNDRWIFARCTPTGELYVSAVIPGILNVDVTDRWPRQLGQVDLARYLGVACGILNPIDIQNIFGGAVVDPRARTWALNQATDSVQTTPMAGALWDVSDRWARQLGQIDLARVLGAPLSAVNPVIAGLYDAVGNRMPSMDVAARPGYVDVIDRAARLLGIIYGDVGQLAQRAVTRDAYAQLRSAGVEIDPRDVSDRWARQVGQVDLARVLGAALTAANPVIAGVYDAAGNRMPPMDTAARRGYVEVAPPSTLQQGTRTTTIGVPIPISAAAVTLRSSVIVQADPDNTGRIKLGNNVAQPLDMPAGDYVVIVIDDVQKIYFDVTVDNERVNWTGA